MRHQDLLAAVWQLHQKQGERARVLRKAGGKMSEAAKLVERALELMQDVL
jgi:hypothetical protein